MFPYSKPPMQNTYKTLTMSCGFYRLCQPNFRVKRVEVQNNYYSSMVGSRDLSSTSFRMEKKKQAFFIALIKNSI